VRSHCDADESIGSALYRGLEDPHENRRENRAGARCQRHLPDLKQVLDDRVSRRGRGSVSRTTGPTRRRTSAISRYADWRPYPEVDVFSVLDDEDDHLGGRAATEAGSGLPVADRPVTTTSPSRRAPPVHFGGAMRSARHQAHEATMARRAGVAKTERQQIPRFGPRPDGPPPAAVDSFINWPAGCPVAMRCLPGRGRP
jgi:hypothetical protein